MYGGYGNTFRNIRVADTLVYSGVTVSSLDFGYPMDEFGSQATTNFENILVERSGGRFWGQQLFGAVWIFSASKPFQGIRFDGLTITDPTYSGIMFQTNYSGGQPQNAVQDTVFTDTTITGAKQNPEYPDRSGFGIWANPMPEVGQGPAVGKATFDGLTLSGNYKDIENRTSTFQIVRTP
ncbi:hypothetical protein GCM10025865_15000 [Paraoerskovia sediminicola]|uniref:Alpha-1,3-glucanase catalytic domain-containing protein n=1 Tax=Paraoerskovia sediminicola TaxID=1138587 RepID=A0ABM8G2B8_9CELL|nr:hypothetical protein [Paraoerskovia sediminicola]BDZ42201.1 hypothetical protein GCM10025865_15000 [Paraoerskovia sediminicola]